MPTHLTARLAWHNDGWDGSVCRSPERNTYCVGCKSFPGDVIARGRDLKREQLLAGRAGGKLEGYIPPCLPPEAEVQEPFSVCESFRRAHRPMPQRRMGYGPLPQPESDC